MSTILVTSRLTGKTWPGVPEPGPDNLTLRVRRAGPARLDGLLSAGGRGGGDVLMLQIKDIRRYGFAIERLGNSPLFAVPYFERVDIPPALEDGYLDIEQAKSVS